MIKIFLYRTSIFYICMHRSVHTVLYLINNYCPMSKCYEQIYYLVYNLGILTMQAFLRINFRFLSLYLGYYKGCKTKKYIITI